MTTSDNKLQLVTTRGTTSDNEWQRMTTSGTTNDNESTTSGKEWQRVTTNDNEWQRVTKSGTANKNGTAYSKEWIIAILSTAKIDTLLQWKDGWY